MRNRCTLGWKSLLGAALVLLGMAGEAEAREFAMSGSWELRRGQVFLPFQLAIPTFGTKAGMRFANMTTTAPFPLMGGGGWKTGPFDPLYFAIGAVTTFPIGMTLMVPGAQYGCPTETFSRYGDWSCPNGDIMAKAGAMATVTAMTGSGLAITIPKYQFGGVYTGQIPLKGLTIVQITSNFSANGPFTTAMLKKGGGPGGFTWCPGDPLCMKAGGSTVTDPPKGTGTRNGRIIYTAGKNKFGGVIQMLLKKGGINSFLFNTSPAFQVGHVKFGAGATIQAQVTGGAYANMNMVLLKYGVITTPMIVPTPNALVTSPGGKRTTMGMNTLTPSSPPGVISYLMKSGQPASQFTAQSTSNTGFPATTGQVIAQQSTGTGGRDFHTLTGSDSRTKLGAGNITLVSGGLSKRNTLAGNTSYATWGRLKLTFFKDVPSMSPAGFAAAGALMLLAVGYALRRRLV